MPGLGVNNKFSLHNGDICSKVVGFFPDTVMGKHCCLMKAVMFYINIQIACYSPSEWTSERVNFLSIYCEYLELRTGKKVGN